MLNKFKPKKEGGKRKSNDDEKLMIGLDIGTEFVKALIARVDDNNELEIIGVGRTHQSQTDMQAGAIADIAAVVANCDAALAQAEQQAGTSGRSAVIGIAGELHIGGIGLARGYLNRPDLTAEKFIKHPFNQDPQARLYKTGDLARYLSDGNIEFLGRIDHQVKIKGYRIELGEIEANIAKHKSVKSCVVIAKPDKEEHANLVAYIVLHKEPTQTTHMEEKAAKLREKNKIVLIRNAQKAVFDAHKKQLKGLRVDTVTGRIEDKNSPAMQGNTNVARFEKPDKRKVVWGKRKIMKYLQQLP